MDKNVGPFATPMPDCGNVGQAGGQKGGDNSSQFSAHKQTGSDLPIQTIDSLMGNPNSAGSFQTPMDTTPSIGVTGSSRAGNTEGGISSPFKCPY